MILTLRRTKETNVVGLLLKRRKIHFYSVLTKSGSFYLSQLANHFVSDPHEVVKVQQKGNAEDSGWCSANYALYKLSLRQDSTVFTLDDGNVVVELKSFGYYYKIQLYQDTVYLTTLKTISYMYDGAENFRPIKRPVVKIF